MYVTLADDRVRVQVLVYELVNMKAITGSPIQTKPSVNVMIGERRQIRVKLAVIHRNFSS